ncbi:hypothetical protein ACU8DI_08040 [Psychroserpens sp. BH13MA-6]
MKTTKKHQKYTEWLSAEEMHSASKQWLSELEFIEDEHLFFNDLITTFTSELIAPDKFSKGRELIDLIFQSQKQNNVLQNAVKTHENDLQIMVDGVNQIKEEQAYMEEHLGLISLINDFLKDYRVLKRALFDLIKTIKKEDKLRHLINRK